MMSFSLDKDQQTKLSVWLNEQYNEIGELQLAENEKDPNKYPFVYRRDDGSISPYFGAIGGELTYEFSPTGLGDVVIVTMCKGSKWERQINLTDYDSW
jgi:hypothetical protein